MKRIISLLLTVLMLSAIPGLAEETMCLRQIPLENYRFDLALTRESYPEIRITPHNVYGLFSDNSVAMAEPLFLCFSLPGEATADEFDTDSVHCTDDVNMIRYSYKVKESDSWEEFLNLAETENDIVLDEDGMAAYVVPEEREAYGMLATEKFGRSSKMVIGITLDAPDRHTPEAQIVSALTEAITEELKRVRSEMVYEMYDPYWNLGEYAGLRLLDYHDPEYMFRLELPRQLTHTLPDGTVVQAGLIVTGFYNDKITGVYDFGGGEYVEFSVELDVIAFAKYLLEKEKDPDAREVMLDSGITCYICPGGLTEEGKAFMIYACIPLNRIKFDEPCWLEINLTANGRRVRWYSLGEALSSVLLFSDYEEMNAADDPYVPAARQE